jgi:hypothetical protein
MAEHVLTFMWCESQEGVTCTLAVLLRTAAKPEAKTTEEEEVRF